jgi:hypothetical protein
MPKPFQVCFLKRFRVFRDWRVFLSDRPRAIENRSTLMGAKCNNFGLIHYIIPVRGK